MPSIRIATWNLQRPRKSRPQRAEVLQACLRSQKADIWILTETNSMVTPGPDYTPVESSRISHFNMHSEGESRTTIWSRFEIADRLETHAGDTAVCVEINSPAGPLIVYGTVLPYHSAGTTYPYVTGGKAIEGKRNWQFHYESIEEHAADWRRLRAAYPEHVFCLAGDFNQSRDGRKHTWGRQWYGTNKGRQLLGDKLLESGLRCVTEEDFIGSGKLESKSTIDHICVDDATATRPFRVGAWDAPPFGNKPASDHNGVWVNLDVA